MCAWHYLSKQVCLIRPHSFCAWPSWFAQLFATVEENMCSTSSVRQVVPPEMWNELSPVAICSDLWVWVSCIVFPRLFFLVVLLLAVIVLCVCVCVLFLYGDLTICSPTVVSTTTLNFKHLKLNATPSGKILVHCWSGSLWRRSIREIMQIGEPIS